LLESTTQLVLARFGSTLLARISNADVRLSSPSRPSTGYLVQRCDHLQACCVSQYR
jgi:hypothetical protein